MLIEHDPHQIIEGTLIAAYAVRRGPGVHLRAGRVRPRPRAHDAALNEAYAHGAVGQRHLRLRLLDRRRHPPRRRRLHLRRGDRRCSRAWRASGASPASSRRTSRPSSASTAQPTIVNNVETMSNLPWIVLNGGAAFAALGEGTVHRHADLLAVGPREAARQLRGRDGKTTFRDLIYDPELRRRHPQRQRAEGVHPRRRVGALVRSRAARHAPRPGRGAARPARCSARARSSSWTTPPAWCGPRGASPGSSTASRAASARRAARAAAGSRRSCCRIEQGAGREADLDLLLDVCDNIAPGVCRGRRSRRRSASLGPSIPVADHLGHPDVPRRVPRPHQGRAVSV